MHRVHLAGEPRRHCPALFLDRDGTIVDDPGYLSDPDKLVLLPGAVPALRRFAEAGYALVLVTNQSGIGRGYFDWADYERVAARLRENARRRGRRPRRRIRLRPCAGRRRELRLAEAGAGHDSRGGEGASISTLAASLMVGDKPGDLQAGEAAGVGRAVHVLTGHGADQRSRQQGLGRVDAGST